MKQFVFLIELWSRFEDESNTFGLVLRLEPGFKKVFGAIFQQTGCGVSNFYKSSPTPLDDIIDDDKVPLVPMHDARHRHFVAQLLPSDPYPGSPEADGFGSIADAQQGNPLPGDMAPLAQGLQ